MNRHPPNIRDVFHQHFDFVWRSLRRLGVRESDMQGQAQRVFVTAHAELPEHTGEVDWTPWLFALCLRAARECRGAAAPRRAGSGEHPAPAGAAAHGDLAETVVAKLPENQRVVFVLYELEELPVCTIAELLGVSAGTVRSRLRLARECFGREVRRLSIREADVERGAGETQVERRAAL